MPCSPELGKYFDKNYQKQKSVLENYDHGCP